MDAKYPIESIIHQERLNPKSEDVCNAIAWSENGQKIAIGTNDGNLSIWEVEITNNRISVSESPIYEVNYDSPVNIIEWAPHKISMNGLVVGLAKGAFEFVDFLGEKIEQNRHRPTSGRINDIKFSDNKLVLAYQNGNIAICQKPFESNPRIQTRKLFNEEPKAISINENSVIAIGYINGDVGFYNLREGGGNLDTRYSPFKKKEGTKTNTSIHCVKWHSGTLLVASKNGNILCLDVDPKTKDFQILQMLEDHVSVNDYAISITSSPDEKIVAFKTIKGFVHLYFSDKNSEWLYVEAYDEVVMNRDLPHQNISFSPREYIIASCLDEDQEVVLRLFNRESLRNKFYAQKNRSQSSFQENEDKKGKLLFYKVANDEDHLRLVELIRKDEFSSINAEDLIMTLTEINSELRIKSLYKIKVNTKPDEYSLVLEEVEEVNFEVFEINDKKNHNKYLSNLLDKKYIPLGENDETLEFLNYYRDNIKGYSLLSNLVLQIWEPLESMIHTEAWDGKDALGYNLYANAISKFIRNELTKPPITIGIQGSWGYGKTTLMRLIKKEFDELGGGIKSQQNEENTLTVSRIISWFKNDLDEEDFSNYSYPTVWFNAWKFEDSKKIWGGLVGTIIESLVDSLESEYQRAKFWFKLKAGSFDINDLRKEFYSFLFVHSLSTLLFSLGGAVLFLVFYLFVLPNGYQWIGVTGISVSAIAPFIKSIHAYYKKSVAANLKSYFSEPDLINKESNFQKIESYLKKALKAFDSKNNPIVIFIDDLDRCAPSTIVDVFEAINMFLNGEFENCYFVIGIDTKNVANAIDEKYSGYSSNEPSRLDKPSIGWNYINKFIQLPFVLPKLTTRTTQKYLEFLLQDKDLTKVGGKDKPLEKLGNGNITSPNSNNIETEEVSKLSKDENEGSRPVQEKKLTNRAMKAVREYIPQINGSPRTIKRFLNLYRFNMYIYKAKNKASNDITVTPSEIAYWSSVMIKMPKLIHWIQTGSRDIIDIDLKSIEDRAKRIDEVIGKIQHNYYQTEDSEYGDNWEYELSEKLDISREENHWLAQEGSKDLLISNYTMHSSFSNAVKVGLI